MIDVVKIWQALASKESLFKNAITELSANISVYEEAQDRLSTLTFAEVEEILSHHVWSGAKPTKEFEIYPSLRVPFSEKWSNHRESRKWALEILRAQPTFAVDGSQIHPDRNFSFLTGLVQIGWFENAHLETGDYIKNIAVEVFSPDELTTDNELIPLQEVINTHRFVKETERLCQYMEANVNVNPKPICFFDGSFIVSFAQHLHPKIQAQYSEAVKKLLETSEKSRVPIVAYIDKSYARDFMRMLSLIFGLHDGGRLSDVYLLNKAIGEWGDRSQIFQCSRKDNLLDKDFYHQVYFTYLKTSEVMPPARIEMPAWIFEAGGDLYQNGLHNRVLDVIRAECITGTRGSYPYVLETADAVAALTLSDQKSFHKILKAFLHTQDFEFRLSSKGISKGRRRS
jgi:hypothetical protein